MKSESERGLVRGPCRQLAVLCTAVVFEQGAPRAPRAGWGPSHMADTREPGGSRVLGG